MCPSLTGNVRFMKTHGGLTPAALAKVRSHIAEIVISSAIEHRATRSGWREPAVET
jgi:hypothetical protein